MATRYVIVGGSAAGMAAAHTIRKKDTAGTITVLSRETSAPYFRPMIPYTEVSHF
jgi:NADPH-dependent 2,4-dienoyl-CoA reductase/sulfur reductase-like enzyme